MDSKGYDNNRHNDIVNLYTNINNKCVSYIFRNITYLILYTYIHIYNYILFLTVAFRYQI